MDNTYCILGRIYISSKLAGVEMVNKIRKKGDMQVTWFDLKPHSLLTFCIAILMVIPIVQIFQNLKRHKHCSEMFIGVKLCYVRIILS